MVYCIWNNEKLRETLDGGVVEDEQMMEQQKRNAF